MLAAMFRIRRIYDNVLSRDQNALAQAQEILRTQFIALSEEEIDKLPDLLRNPVKYGFRPILFVVEDARDVVRAFAVLLHAADLDFCFLDFISTAKAFSGRGIGGVLYARLREEALALTQTGLFFEVLPDDPALCRDPDTLKQNTKRLRFYERYGARPIVNTAYEKPVTPCTDNAPYLVFDDLGRNRPLERNRAQKIVRAILERKYLSLCGPPYIEMVVNSFREDPVRLRAAKYVKKEPQRAGVGVPGDKKIALVVNDEHAVHHVRERGYVEAPVRIRAILKELEQTDLFAGQKPQHFAEKHLRSVHDARFIDYLKTVCLNTPPEKSVYPYVFPVRNATRPPKELSVRAGYYCIDTFTPLNQSAYRAAVRAVDCALTAAAEILKGRRLAYALVRPPGHHAERKSFGGFCYFNSAAIAAEFLSQHGKVAIVDVDYHHGNGQQNIFFERNDVFTASLHAHPSFAYPYFSGFEDEKGAGGGIGFNLNLTLPENAGPEQYRERLGRIFGRVRRFDPQFLIIALGLDTARGDPTGSFGLQPKDFEENGKTIGSLKLPTLVVQEGGYNIRVLGVNARRFFSGLWAGANS
jgi:acetoin utilization deacetylase AcuC-like enzyme/GNAT superfamily N-acetyltransferase